MKSNWGSRITELLTHRYWPLIVAGVAALLTLSSLAAGLAADDYFIRMVLLQPDCVPVKLPGRLDTFSFVKSPEFTAQAMESGSFPWWSDREVTGRFWRPLASITHFIDFHAWPDHVWLMHLHSVFWYAGCVFVVALVFRRLMGATVAAGLAALLFAVEENHGIPVGWLANRSIVLACFFGLGALLLHHAWRKEGSRAKGVAAVGVFAAALLSAEAGIAAMAYITAYALALDRGPWRGRLLSLLPYIVTIVAWRVIWISLGYGVFRMALYTDPLGEPWEFIRGLFVRGPQIITAQLAAPPAEIQAIAARRYPWTWLFSAIVAAVIAVLAWPMVKTDRVARFFALGTVFAVVPACTTIPQSRCLAFVEVGAFGLLALWLISKPQSAVCPRTVKVLAALAVLLHLIIAPAALGVCSFLPVRHFARMQWSLALPDTESLNGRCVIVVNHPMPVLLYDLSEKAMHGRPMPAQTRVLCHAFTPITLERISPTELRLHAPRGIPGPFCRWVFRHSPRLVPGAEVAIDGLTARIAGVDPDQMPIEAVFTFDRDLDDASFQWLWWTPHGFRPFNVPEIGEGVHIPFEPPLPKWMRPKPHAGRLSSPSPPHIPEKTLERYDLCRYAAGPENGIPTSR